MKSANTGSIWGPGLTRDFKVRCIEFCSFLSIFYNDQEIKTFLKKRETNQFSESLL